VLLEKEEGVRPNVQMQSVKWLPPLPRGVKPWKEWSRDYLTKVRKAKAGFELVGWFLGDREKGTWGTFGFYWYRDIIKRLMNMMREDKDVAARKEMHLVSKDTS
jgi:hypothetical protein